MSELSLCGDLTVLFRSPSAHPSPLAAGALPLTTCKWGGLSYSQPGCLALQLYGRGGSWAWWGKPIISAMEEAGKCVFKACLGQSEFKPRKGWGMYVSEIERLTEALGSTPRTAHSQYGSL